MTIAMTPIIIVFLVVVVPIWLGLHYSGSWRKHRPFSEQDAAMLRDLHEAAEKINDRLSTIERILDDEIPDWRKTENDKL